MTSCRRHTLLRPVAQTSLTRRAARSLSDPSSFTRPRTSARRTLRRSISSARIPPTPAGYVRVRVVPRKAPRGSVVPEEELKLVM
jgi:hypothetical protein